MSTSPVKTTEQVVVIDVQFEGNILTIALNDGRELRLHLDRIEWLQWLANATPEQRANWSLEPGGFAVYWEDLDDGIEICHLLGLQPLV